MKALLLHPEGDFRLGEIDPHPGGPGFVTVEPLLVGVCGSDVHIARGRHRDTSYPIALGHEIVGRLVGGDGQLVAIDPVEGCGHCQRCRENLEHVCAQVGIVGVTRHGGLAEQVVVRESHVHPIPPTMSDRVAAVAEALAVAVRAVARGGVGSGDVVVVLGGGPIGLMVALTARDAGATRVIVVEPADERRRISADLGFDVIESTEPVDRLRSAIGGIGADVVFDAAGHPSLPPMLTSLVRSGGTVVAVGLHHDDSPIDLLDVVTREIAVVGTRALAPGDMVGAVELLVRRASEFEAFTDDVVSPSEMGASLDRLERGETMKVLIDVSELRGET